MPFPNTSYNLATGNKWLLVLPFKTVDPTFSVDNLSLNVSNFSIPELSMATTEIGIRGSTFPIPTGVRNESKSIAFNYMMSSDWHQYQLLYQWFNNFGDKNNLPIAPKMDQLMDISVFFLSEFKNPLFSIIFRGSWIMSLDSLDLNYQSGEENVQHGFTINYGYYEFDGLLE